MTRVLGFYLCLAPMLYFVAGGTVLDSHPFVMASAWGVHALAFLLYTILVEDSGFRRGWEVYEHARRQPPGSI
jgi:hypothetical protein